MKTIVSISLALCVLMGTAFAQLPSQPTPDDANRQNGVVRDGFTLAKGGRVMVTRDGVTDPVVQEFVLTNGTHLYPNGDIILYTGDRQHLGANQLLTLDGTLFDTPVTAQGVAPVYPPGARKDPVVGVSSRDGITVSGNDTLITRNGVTEKVSKPFQLSSGVVVNPDGSFTPKNGKSLILRENQILGFDGVVRDARIHDTGPAVTPATSGQ
jgi:hypothetical protein